jgi:hypothetical protein
MDRSIVSMNVLCFLASIYVVFHAVSIEPVPVLLLIYSCSVFAIWGIVTCITIYETFLTS